MKNKSPLVLAKMNQPVISKQLYTYLIKRSNFYKILNFVNFCTFKHKNYIGTNCRYYSDNKDLRNSNHESEEDVLTKKPQNRSAKLREEFKIKEQYWDSLVNLESLRDEDIKILQAHRAAVAAGHFTYDDPETSFRVMTRLRHFLRRTCCGNACRHCVYDHENVPEELKENRVFNSAFWVNKWELKRPLLEDKIDSPVSKDKIKVNDKENLSIDLLFSTVHNQEDEEEELDPELFKH